LFPFLCWPLWDFFRVAAEVKDPGLRSALRRGRYSIRMLRYWWAANAIAEEAQKLSRPPVIVDLGCGRGWLKLLTDRLVCAKWIGLDGHIEYPELASAGYERVAQCDFEAQLPVDDASVDMVVSLHVFEHLHDPDKTMREVCRILRPGGVFLGGTPVLPSPFALLRTAWHQFRHWIGKPSSNGHARSFSPASWQRLLDRHGFEVDFMTGSHVTRLSRHPLESRAWWIRINQVVGRLFPSLGAEVYLLARRPSTDRKRCRSALMAWRLGDWLLPPVAIGLAAAAMFMAPGRDSFERIHAWLEEHRDHDDVYFLCALADKHQGLDLPVLQNPRERGFIYHLDPECPHDVHVVVELEDARAWMATGSALHWKVVDRHEGRRGHLLLLSMREPGQLLADYLQTTDF
jgi:SAM-dependent methyltransferase